MVTQGHQGVDIFPPPVRQRKARACGGVVVIVKGGVGGGVKVVVKMDTVKGIIAAKLRDCIGNKGAHLGVGRIQIQAVGGGFGPFRVGQRQTLRTQQRKIAALQPVGVEPGFQLSLIHI